MMKFYRIGKYRDPTEFLALVAERFGYASDGGVFNQSAAARRVLRDWNTCVVLLMIIFKIYMYNSCTLVFYLFSGNIIYYTLPPVQHTLPCHINANIVQKMSNAFDIDALLAQETEDLNSK